MTAVFSVSRYVPSHLSFETSDGRKIDTWAAQRLCWWRERLIPASIAGHVWHTLFSDDDRSRLGGNLQIAWRSEGTIAMFMRARHVIYERAVLEIAWGLGWMPPADYQRLLEALGGQAAGRLT